MTAEQEANSRIHKLFLKGNLLQANSVATATIGFKKNSHCLFEPEIMLPEFELREI